MKRKTKKQPVQVHLGNEVAVLASQVVRAIKGSATSQEVRSIGRDTLGTMRGTRSRLLKAFQKAREDEAAQDIKLQARRVYDIGKKRTRGSAKDLKRNLAKGLQSIGSELQRLAEHLRKK